MKGRNNGNRSWWCRLPWQCSERVLATEEKNGARSMEAWYGRHEAEQCWQKCCCGNASNRWRGRCRDVEKGTRLSRFGPLSLQKGHSQNAKRPQSRCDCGLLASLSSFRAVFGLGDMSIKFKRLVVSGLEISSKLAYFRPIIRPTKISQTQRAKWHK